MQGRIKKPWRFLLCTGVSCFPKHREHVCKPGAKRLLSSEWRMWAHLEFTQGSVQWGWFFPPDGSPFTMAFQCFRWNKDVTIMIAYEMRVNKLALHQRAFYSREDYNKDRRCIVTPILPHFHNNTALWLQWARNQERDLRMFYLWADFSVSKKGEGLLQVIDGSINSPNWSAFGNLFTSWVSKSLTSDFFKGTYWKGREPASKRAYHQNKTHFTEIKLFGRVPWYLRNILPSPLSCFF